MSRSVARLFQSLAPMFRPPFEGLGWLVVLYFGWCFFVYPNSQTLRGNLPDPDDYMYLNQVLDWVQGQGWFDNIQHRLNPPEGVPIHFSRLAQIPMALPILFLQKLGLGPRASAMLTALIYPLILFGILLVAFRRLAENFVPKDWAGITPYIALFAGGMTFMFTPGHVDHHNVIIILVIVALDFCMRMMLRPDKYIYGLYAGLALALSLVVALEVLPWILVITAWMGVWAAIKGGKAAYNGLILALALYLGSALGLASARPPEQWLVPDVLTYSYAYLLLTGGIAFGFAGIAAVARLPLIVRVGVGATLAALSGYLFLHRFPEMIAGPYGGMDPELAQMMLGEIDEAQPLLKIRKGFLDIFNHTAAAWLSLFAAGYYLSKSSWEERWRLGLLSLLLITAFGLTLFYQYRFMGMLGAFTVIPLAMLLQRGWSHIGATLQGRRQVFAEIGLLLLVGPLPAVLFPALADGRSFNAGVLLFPVDGSVKRTPCDMYELEKILGSKQGFGDHPRLLFSSMGQGPELLFRTPHQVLSAPYHMDVSGNIDATRFFSTPYASEAEAIARRRNADLVVACRYVPEFYTRAPEGQQHADANTVSRDFSPHFIELLMTGKAPDWLKLAYFPRLSNFLIYDLKYQDSGKKKADGIKTP